MTVVSPEDTTLKKIIFLHLPKTGGTTFNSIIDRRYKPREIFKVDGSKIDESIGKFNQLSEYEKQEIKLFRGHMHFGWHRYISQSSTYVTFLRNPVDRVISNYRFILRRPLHYLYSEVKSMTLQDYVKSQINPSLNGGQVRLLSGLESEPLSETTLATAKNNIKTHFSVVGLTEKFDEALILIAKLYGWRFPFYIKQNVASRSDEENISEQTLELIQEANFYDMELYKFAQVLFKEKINLLVGEQKFQANLEQFKQLNKVYGVLYKNYCWGKSLIKRA